MIQPTAVRRSVAASIARISATTSTTRAAAAAAAVTRSHHRTHTYRNQGYRAVVICPAVSSTSGKGYFTTTTTNNNNNNSSIRNHYSYAGPGRFGDERHRHDHDHDGHHEQGSSSSSSSSSIWYNPQRYQNQSWTERGFTVGIGGPVGSGKTALVLELIKRLGSTDDGKKDNDKKLLQPRPPLGVVTNDIFTQEDAQFLHRNQDVLDKKYILPVETGGCPHAAIREDVSANLTACEQLTSMLTADNDSDASSTSEEQQQRSQRRPPIILCESGGDNLAANFSRELADLTLYVIDVAGGDKVPRKGGPGITQSDLLCINKIDLADAVGADLNVMERDANMMRRSGGTNDDDDDDGTELIGPTVFASVKNGTAVDEIEDFILSEYAKATTTTVGGGESS